MMQPDEHASLEQRVIALEEAAMHREHMVSRLNAVICEIQDHLDEQARQLKRMKDAMEQQQNEESEERSFEDERPPHY